jgi:hypothetical protein
MDRERAKSRADAASKEAAAEAAKWSQLRAVEHIDDEGNYTTAYHDTIAVSEFAKEETRKAFGNDFEKFKTEWRKMGPKKFVRQYKDPNEIETSLQKVYGSIEARQQAELSRPVLTGFDAMLGSMVNRVSSAVGGKPVFGSDPQETPEMAELETMTGAQPEPMSNYESPEFAPVKEEEKFEHTFKQNEKGEWVAIFANANGVKTQDTGVISAVDDGSGVGKSRQIRDVQEQRWFNGKPVHDVKEVTYRDANGAIVIEEGVKDENGVFRPLAGLSKFSDVNKPEMTGPYEGDFNNKQAQLAQDVLYSSVRATKGFSNVEALYNPRDYGSQELYSEVGNAWTAFWRVTNSGFKGGVAEKDRVLDAVSKGEAFHSLPSEVQKAVIERDYSTLREISKKQNDAEFKDTLDAFGASATTKEEENILSEFRRTSIRAEMQPIVRDLLRAWTGGDKKPAWGAAEHLLKEIKANSSPEKILAMAKRYKMDMARTAQANLKIKFDASRFSMANNMEAGFIPEKLDDMGATEYRRNKVTGDYMMVVSGRDTDQNPVRYYLTSEGKPIYQVKLPRKGVEMTPQEQQIFKYTNNLLSTYTEVLNEHGSPIN